MQGDEGRREMGGGGEQGQMSLGTTISRGMRWWCGGAAAETDWSSSVPKRRRRAGCGLFEGHSAEQRAVTNVNATCEAGREARTRARGSCALSPSFPKDVGYEREGEGAPVWVGWCVVDSANCFETADDCIVEFSKVLAARI